MSKQMCPIYTRFLMKKFTNNDLINDKFTPQEEEGRDIAQMTVFFIQKINFL